MGRIRLHPSKCSKVGSGAFAEKIRSEIEKHEFLIVPDLGNERIPIAKNK